MATAKPPRSCHAGRSRAYARPYYFPSWMLRADQEEQQRQCDDDQENKLGIDPRRDHHPILNPSREELEHRATLQRESIEQDRLKHLSDTQQEYYRKAVELIKSGGVKSLVDLGSRFTHSYGDDKGKCFSAIWARDLLKKMVLRGTFTEEQLKQLVPDQTVPKRERKRDCKEQ